MKKHHLINIEIVAGVLAWTLSSMIMGASVAPLVRAWLWPLVALASVFAGTTWVLASRRRRQRRAEDAAALERAKVNAPIELASDNVKLTAICYVKARDFAHANQATEDFEASKQAHRALLDAVREFTRLAVKTSDKLNANKATV